MFCNIFAIIEMSIRIFTCIWSGKNVIIWKKSAVWLIRHLVWNFHVLYAILHFYSISYICFTIFDWNPIQPHSHFLPISNVNSSRICKNQTAWRRIHDKETKIAISKQRSSFLLCISIFQRCYRCMHHCYNIIEFHTDQIIRDSNLPSWRNIKCKYWLDCEKSIKIWCAPSNSIVNVVK